MKKGFQFLAILFIFIIVSRGCTANHAIMSYDSQEYVQLYNYKEISIDYDYTQISSEDVKNIIAVELSCNEAYVPVTNRETIMYDDILLISIDGEKEYYFVGSGGFSDLFDEGLVGKRIGNDVKIAVSEKEALQLDIVGIFRNATIKDRAFILDYYKFADYSALERYIKDRASNEIIFNYLYDIICKNSIITGYPEEIKKQISRNMDYAESMILKRYYSLDEYLGEQGISYKDFQDEIASYYNDCILYKAILENDGIYVTQEEIDGYNNEDNLDCYEIYRTIAEEKVRKLLTANAVIQKKAS